MPFDPELLALLRCPISRGPLRLSDDGRWLISDEAHVRYPIVDDIPQLVAEAAEPLKGES
jgi:hypothetical protein